MYRAKTAGRKRDENNDIILQRRKGMVQAVITTSDSKILEEEIGKAIRFGKGGKASNLWTTALLIS